jgi:hypothetical protein
MATTLVRFNQVQPGLEPNAMADRYQASLDMAAYADTHGFALVTLEEHHRSSVPVWSSAGAHGFRW